MGREIETGRLFTMIPPPDPEVVDQVLDSLVQKAEDRSGYFLLPHQNKEGRTSNFASNVEEGVKALGNRELTSLGNFSTDTDLTPVLHLPFYGAGGLVGSPLGSRSCLGDDPKRLWGCL